MLELSGVSFYELVSTQESLPCREVDPELFFPSSHDSAGVVAAKAICRGCPIRYECLDYALRQGEVGVWGGSSDAERRTIKRRGMAYLLPRLGVEALLSKVR